MGAVPQFALTPRAEWTSLTAADTTKTGATLTPIATIGTAGGRLKRLRLVPIGTNVQTVLRVFLNNGSTPATPANNMLLFEITLPATTLSETNANVPVIVPLPEEIPPSYKLMVCLATAVAAGWQIGAFWDDF